MLYIDYRELTARDGRRRRCPAMPVLPAFDPDSPAPPPGPDGHHRPRRCCDAAADGRAHGRRRAGADRHHRSRLGRARSRPRSTARGEYIKTVALNSPGGSVNDALAIGELIRENGLRHQRRGRRALRLVLPAGLCRRHRAAGRRRRGHRRAPDLCAGRGRRPADRGAGGRRGDVGRAEDDRDHHPAPQRHGRRSGALAACARDAADRLYYLSPEEMATYRLTTAPAAGGGA